MRESAQIKNRGVKPLLHPNFADEAPSPEFFNR
jgi:hypothetical protein